MVATHNRERPEILTGETATNRSLWERRQPEKSIAAYLAAVPLR